MGHRQSDGRGTCNGGVDVGQARSIEIVRNTNERRLMWGAEHGSRDR